jgi:serine/threonine-protein kinase
VLERAGRPTAPERFSPRELGQALVQAAEKMPRPTPIEVVGTGLFDEDVAVPVAEKVEPVVVPPPVPNIAPNETLVIRTTPGFDAPSAPIAIPNVDITDSALAPLTIGGDDTGPIAVDAETLRELAAEDPTAQVARPKKKWGRRIAIVSLVLVLLAGAGAGAYFTVLNPKNPVPALAGLTEAEARNQISQFGWKINLVRERNDDVAAEQVIRTDPVLGANLAKRDTLTVVVSQGPTLSVLVEVTGLTAEEATAKITELGLVPAAADVPDETIAAGIVVSWSIPDQPTLKVGDSVVKGTTVAINVSTGPAERDIPDLKGLSLVDATAKLTELGLVVAEAPTAPHPDIPAGQVSAQVPAAGEKLPKGGTVTITISKGQETTLVPSIIGKDFATVKERLERYGMVIGTVTGNKNRGLKTASIDGKSVKNFDRVVVGKTVDLVFP